MAEGRGDPSGKPLKIKVAPITKDRIIVTAQQMFGSDVEVLFLPSLNGRKNSKLMKVFFMVLGQKLSFDIRGRDLIDIARTLVGIHARVRASIINEMSGQVAALKDNTMRRRVAAEKDRLAGRSDGAVSPS